MIYRTWYFFKKIPDWSVLPFGWSCFMLLYYIGLPFTRRLPIFPLTKWFQKFLLLFTPGKWFQFDENVFQMGWFNHHLAVLCFLKHRIMTFMNQGHLLQTPWQQLHKGTGATWRLKQSVPICRFFGSFKKWWFKKKPVFSCVFSVLSPVIIEKNT